VWLKAQIDALSVSWPSRRQRCCRRIPAIKQLSSELADVRVQIRAEANKIVKSLEHEAVVAAARETSLRNSLTEVQTQASGMSDAEVKLRALDATSWNPIWPASATRARATT
jgi:uncharacterized protein involved in exopolysaccharide biosynthesis